MAPTQSSGTYTGGLRSISLSIRSPQPVVVVGLQAVVVAALAEAAVLQVARQVVVQVVALVPVLRVGPLPLPLRVDEVLVLLAPPVLLLLRLRLFQPVVRLPLVQLVEVVDKVDRVLALDAVVDKVVAPDVVVVADP